MGKNGFKIHTLILADFEKEIKSDEVEDFIIRINNDNADEDNFSDEEVG